MNGNLIMTDRLSNTWIIVAAILLAYFIWLNSRKDQEIASLKEEVRRSRELSEEIKRRLNNLLSSGVQIDEHIAQELMQIIPLLEIKQETKAILTLAKVIENLLKELYKDDAEFHGRFKKNGPSFNDYLEHAKSKKVISQEDFHLISILRIIRNEEAHELNVQREESRIAAAFIAGLTLVFDLYRLTRDTISAK